MRAPPIESAAGTCLAVAVLLGSGCGAVPAAGGSPMAPSEPPASPTAPGAWDRELPAGVRLLDETEGPRTHAVIRVLDAATDRPIAGARITCHEEAIHPTAGGTPPVQDLVADEDGEALLDLAREGSWTICEAPGYGPRGFFGGEEDIHLARGEDAVLLVRDWLERPLAGAGIEALVGCGHVPEIRAAVSDAEGRLVLPCLDIPETRLWVRAPGMRGRNEAYAGVLSGLPVEDGVRILRCDPAPTVEGRVLDAATGAPVAGAAVGTTEAHRGPWTRTDAEGRFVLHGADAGEELRVEFRDGRVEEKKSVPGVSFRAEPSAPRTLRIRDPFGPEPELIDEGEEKPLRVRVEAPEGAGTEGMELVFVRAGDGCVRDGSLDAAGTWEGALPEGTWTLAVGGPCGRWQRGRARVVAGKDATVSLRLEENPVRTALKPMNSSYPRSPWANFDHGEYDLLVPEGRFPMEYAREFPDDEYWFPAEGPFTIEQSSSSGGGRYRRFPFLRLWGEDEVQHFPYPPQAESDTTPDPDPPESRVLVMLPDGRPAASAAWTVETDPGRRERSFWNGRLDGEGRGSHPCDGPQRSILSMDEDDHLVPLRVLTGGSGVRSWTWRWPSGALDVRVSDGDGKPVEGAVVMRGEDRWEVPADGLLPLHGLPGGPVRLWVAAPGMRAHDVRLLLPEGGRRSVEVRLRP